MRVRCLFTAAAFVCLSAVSAYGLTAVDADGRALLSKFGFSAGIDVDDDGNVYVADSGNNMIRKIVRRKESR